MKTLICPSLIPAPALVTLMLLILPAASLQAQITDSSGTGTGMRGAPKVYKMDTRSVAMADAGIADATRLSAINNNPAILPFVLQKKSAHFHSSQDWNTNMMIQNLTLPALAYRSHNLAMQLGYYHSGADLTNLLGSPGHPEPDLVMYQVDVIYAITLSTVVGLGVFNSTAYAENEFARYITNFTTLGVLYAPSRSISYGATFRGLGRSVTYEFIETGRTTLGSQNLREALELGATLHYPVDRDNTYLSLSFANEKRFSERGIWYKAGMEVAFYDVVMLRTGIMFHPENKVYIPRFGTGIRTQKVTFDYAFSYKDHLYERFHQIGASIGF